jgi:hypothetical protein
MLLGALLVGLSGCGAKSPEAVNTAASQMVQQSQAHVDQFLNYSQTEGLRNMLRRHDQDWSNPVFFNLTLVVAGTEIGVRSSHVIMLLMTDKAVDDFVKGSIAVGGNGGITVGIGLSVSGAGGPEGGLEVFIISASQGVSIGGGAATIIPALATDLNSQVNRDPSLKCLLALCGHGKLSEGDFEAEDIGRGES